MGWGQTGTGLHPNLTAIVSMYGFVQYFNGYSNNCPKTFTNLHVVQYSD